MKLKRFVSIIAAISVIAASSTGFAATWRYSRKNQVTIPDRSGKNDYYYEDFTGVEPGVLPAGMTGGSNSGGYHTTEVTDIGGGLEKNCYMLVDTDHSNSGGTPSSNISFNNLKGYVGVDIRFKYIPTDAASNWSSFVIEYHSPEGMNSRMVCASANGAMQFNYGGLGSAAVSGQIAHDSWYTVKYVMDFDNQLLDCEFIDEGANTSTQVLQSQFYTDTVFSNLSAIKFRSSVYGGSWFVDYIKVYKADGPMEEAVSDVKKGSAEPNRIPGPKSLAQKGRTNIMMDGRYKFTTKAPKVENGEVLVTAKNVASFFNLAYSVTDNGEVIKGDDIEFTVAADGSGIKKDSSAMKLSASCIAEGNQIFIPIGDIAEALGYEYSYDADANAAVILTGAAAQAETETEVK